MHSFQEANIVSLNPSCTVWREGTLMGVQLRGLIQEPESVLWRNAVTAEFARASHPRFLAFCMADSEPRASLSNRLEVARYVHAMMKNVEWAALHTRRQLLPTSVVRAVRHLVRVPNVTLTHDDVRFASAIVSMRNGQRPA